MSATFCCDRCYAAVTVEDRGELPAGDCAAGSATDPAHDWDRAFGPATDGEEWTAGHAAAERAEGGR